jgi:deoxyribodipyrimidine photo-lyase
MSKFTVFWFRRDLRLEDNAGLYEAMRVSQNVLPLFIFDKNILDQIEDKTDKRVQFIHSCLVKMKTELNSLGSDLLIRHGNPLDVFKQLIKDFKIESVYTNHDYEPYAKDRDDRVAIFLQEQSIEFKSFKDQVIFEKSEILSDQGKPYTVYTPYKNKWLASLDEFYLKSYPNNKYRHHFAKIKKIEALLTEKNIGFTFDNFEFPTEEVSSKILSKYAEQRDFPYLDKGTSLLGIHLRFGTLSVRELAREGKKFSAVWLSELIWREFFMQILWHFPLVEKKSFKEKYEKIKWRTPKDDFELWCQGQTGYPIVDAGMRELNQTGHMHNRVRMVVASFLTKHLLIHWHHGERYFAKKLLDYDLSANNGNWQWAAGTGCDAAPYFRVFNPTSQQEKFDPDFKYIKKWVPEFGTEKYVKPMIDHSFARNRALAEFKKGLEQ